MNPSAFSTAKSPKHDAMQADVLDYLRSITPPKLMIKPRYTQEIECQRRHIEPEYAIYGERGRITGFGDIAEFWSSDGTAKHDVAMLVYELKPNIGSAGGLIRQCKATAALLMERNAEMVCRVVPLVYHDDPDLPTLRRIYMGDIYLWNPDVPEITVSSRE